jgi:transcriptional regulator with XRE-family HTH domain
MLTVGARARIFRERLGLTQKQAADRAGMSQASWSRVENEEKRPHGGEVLGMSWALGVSLDTMRGRSRTRERLQFASRTAAGTAVAESDELSNADEELAFLMECAAQLEDDGLLTDRG